jgi:outer membrane protein
MVGWVGLALAAFAPAYAETRIAIVDFGRLAEEAPQAKAASEAMRTEFTPRQRELQTLQTSVKAKEDRLQKDGATMTPDQRTKAEQEVREGAREFQRKQQELQDDVNARRNEEMSRLQRTLIEEVRVYAKAQNFDLVVADGVVYATPALDITPAILSSLQARAASNPSSGPAAKPAGK